MGGYKALIIEYASQTNSFGVAELWSWLSAKGAISRNTMNCMLTQLVDRGLLSRIARGRYASVGKKHIFKAIPTDNEKKISCLLKEKLPFAPLCIYNGNILVSLQHHLSENRMIYVETDKDAMETVFNILKGDGYDAWLAPKEDMIYRYIDLGKGGVIVKPLVTEAPVEHIDDVAVPTLEKLLVDIKKDPDFFYLQGVEAERMWNNASSIYHINVTRLQRYAKRRGLTIENKVI